LTIRGHRVLLDQDLARLYGVTVKRLNQQVRRNMGKFPAGFLLRLDPKEADFLRIHFASLNGRRGGHRKYPPLVFTEHGAIMAANVLNSPRAVAVSVTVVRAFVRLRQILASHADLARKLEDLERRYDSQFKQVFAAIRALMAPPHDSEKGAIGF